MMIYNVKVTKQNVNYCFFFFFLAVIILIFTSGINTYLGVEISRDTVCASSVWVCGIVWGGDTGTTKCRNMFTSGAGYPDRGVKVVCGSGDSIHSAARQLNK